jgi:hypothetical protein
VSLINSGVAHATEAAMALFDDVLHDGNLVTGLMVGAGALIVWSLIGPALRPITKTAIKGGLIAYREAERFYNDATQVITEILQEVQQEVRATTGASSSTDRSSSRTT